MITKAAWSQSKRRAQTSYVLNALVRLLEEDYQGPNSLRETTYCCEVP